jgi:hypothetical protein
MARPKAIIDQEQFEALCRLNPTLKDAAAFFKVNQDTITDRCKEWGYEGFSDCRDKNMVHTRLTLIRNALKSAEKGVPAMQIFCLKNLCGWTDKQEVQNNSEVKIIIDKDDAEF